VRLTAEALLQEKVLQSGLVVSIWVTHCSQVLISVRAPYLPVLFALSLEILDRLHEVLLMGGVTASTSTSITFAP